jgi:LuxR family maltose regulon positive regulatory protein
MIAPALVTLAETKTWMGEFDDGERWRQRAVLALQTDSGPGIRLLLHVVTGMMHAGRGHLREALDEFSAAERLQSQLIGRHALTSLVTGWTLATQARLGRLDEAGALLAAVDGECADSGEVRNARAVMCLATADPAGALSAVEDVVDGRSPVIHAFTVVEANLLGALAHRELGDLRAANRFAERALGAAEPERLILPFAMTGSGEVLEALPRHDTAHAALLADILDVLHGSAIAVREQPAAPPKEELTASELKVLRYLPTNLSRPEIASQLSVSVNTVNTHVRNIYAKLQASDRSSAVQRARDLRLLSAGSGWERRVT